MNLRRLKRAEAEFLARYPGGFNHPDMIELRGKHKMPEMIGAVQRDFAEHRFRRAEIVVENLVTTVSRSSMVSRFEKPRFRDFCRMLSSLERDALADGLYERLHGDERRGFETWLDLLTTGKVTKWTIMTIIPTYFAPTREVFIKPTTVKGVITALELDDLHYRPRPSWEFYRAFRDRVRSMKKEVDPSLSPSNAAFTGFLMMALPTPAR